MQVMLLAAGRSTRLGALGEQLPKPLVPICGYPAITYGLALCRAAGLLDIVVNLHHHGDKLRDVLGDGGRFGVRIRYSIEEELLGTGGGLAKARALFKEGPVLVMNGKVVANLDLAEVLAAHRAAPTGVVATMVLRDPERPLPPDWSPVGVDATGAVVSLRGQRTDRTPVGSIAERMFTGIQVIEPAIFDRLPDGVSDVITAAHIPLLLAGARIHSVAMSGFFADPSTPARYLEANLALLRHPGLIAHPPGPLSGVDPGARIHPGAHIHAPVRIAPGAEVEVDAVVGPDAVVGAGAKVASGTRLERSVVWPATVARGDLLGAIVTDRETIRG